MKKLLIKQCNDPMMWYANKIGKTVEFLGASGVEGIYWSREDAGYKNIVKMEDAEIVEYDVYETKLRLVK